MPNMTIKDYAASKGVTYEAIRKQIELYKDELEPHIIHDGKKRMLTPEAVEILEDKRVNNKVIMVNENKDKELVEMREKLDQQAVIMLNMQTTIQKQIDENNKLHNELHDKEAQLYKQEQEHSQARQELSNQLVSTLEELKTAELNAAEQRHKLEIANKSISDLEAQNKEYKLLLEQKESEIQANAAPRKLTFSQRLKLLIFNE